MLQVLSQVLPAHWAIVLQSAIVLVMTVLLGLVAHYLAFWTLRRVAAHTTTNLDDLLSTRCRTPSALLFPLIVLSFTAPLLHASPGTVETVRHVASIALISGIAWMLVRLAHVFTDFVEAKYDLKQDNNLQSRKVHTQLRILRRVAATIIIIIATGAILMTFQRVRQLGTSLLASAGLIGLIAGVAAQRTLANLVAGIQIAVTQPIRLDDVVIVEGEWGRVEEITITYVVVRIWDLRRLVLPISYFIEKPFQNWTRVGSEILGTVYLHLDYSVPIDELREELKRVTAESQLWDGKVCGLQVTNATERTVELRALVSAADSPSAWDLRCHVRERLLTYLQKRHPGALPRLRAEIAHSEGRSGEAKAVSV